MTPRFEVPSCKLKKEQEDSAAWKTEGCYGMLHCMWDGSDSCRNAKPSKTFATCACVPCVLPFLSPTKFEILT